MNINIVCRKEYMENYIEIYIDYKIMGMVFFFEKWNTKMKLKIETKIKLL